MTTVGTARAFDAFRREWLARGCDELIARTWAPGTVLEEHTHPFDANAVVVEGEMWLRVGDDERSLGPGDTFAIPKGTPHAERYGAGGATYWVARRN